MNRLCARLGIEVPIVQSGMGGVAGPALAAQVCEAGALGVLAALMTPPDDLRRRIGELRALTGRPFGVNLWLHRELRPPTPPEAVAPDLVDEVRRALDDIRRSRGREPAPGPLPATPDLIDAAVEVLIEERVPVFSAGVGLPSGDLVERFHRAGTTVMAMVIDPVDARAAVEAGVDVVVAQGSEAGGHRSVGTKRARHEATGTGTFVLVPAVRDAVGPGVAVVAAGGVADGRGLAAALVLGADGALLGTRFVATAESEAHPVWKRELVAGSRSTVVTDAFTGQWARALRNEFHDRYQASGARTLPSLLQLGAAGDILATARQDGDVELLPMWAGDSVQLIDDLPTAAEVVRRLVAEAEAALGRPLTAGAGSG
jgi:nitronate monooxygenase